MRPQYKTLAEIVNEVAGDLGLNVRSDQILVSNDSDTKQMGRLVLTTVESLLMLPPYRGDIGTNPFVMDSDGNYKRVIENNDDKILLDGEVLKLGTKWRYLHAKGLTYDEDFRSYEIRRGQLASTRNRDKTVNLNVVTASSEQTHT